MKKRTYYLQVYYLLIFFILISCNSTEKLIKVKAKNPILEQRITENFKNTKKSLSLYKVNRSGKSLISTPNKYNGLTENGFEVIQNNIESCLLQDSIYDYSNKNRQKIKKLIRKSNEKEFINDYYLNNDLFLHEIPYLNIDSYQVDDDCTDFELTLLVLLILLSIAGMIALIFMPLWL